MGVFLCLFFLVALKSSASNELSEALRFSEKAKEPELHLAQSGPLVVLGNANLDTANLIFLPEIHDDPDSLLTQLLLIAREREKNTPFIVLDESLPAMQRSKWDVF